MGGRGASSGSSKFLSNEELNKKTRRYIADKLYDMEFKAGNYNKNTKLTRETYIKATLADDITGNRKSDLISRYNYLRKKAESRK